MALTGPQVIVLATPVFLTVLSSRFGKMAARRGPRMYMTLGPLLMGLGLLWLARVPRVVHTYHGHVFHGYFSKRKSASRQHFSTSLTRRYPASRIVHFSRMQVTTSWSIRRSGA